jgi:transcriptional regulator GlxA family with amidase domain
MLATSDAPVYQIASVCGFAGSEQFARVFRAANGVSPTAYRQERRRR